MLSPAARVFDRDAWSFDALASTEAPPGSSQDRGHVAYLGYAGLALGLHRLVAPSSRFDARHDAIAAALARRFAASPTGLVETYPGETYPVDNTAALGALALHAKATHSRAVARDRTRPRGDPRPRRSSSRAASSRRPSTREPPRRAIQDAARAPRSPRISWRSAIMRCRHRSIARSIATSFAPSSASARSSSTLRRARRARAASTSTRGPSLPASACRPPASRSARAAPTTIAMRSRLSTRRRISSARPSTRAARAPSRPGGRSATPSCSRCSRRRGPPRWRAPRRRSLR